jgi:hypothetical protein
MVPRTSRATAAEPARPWTMPTTRGRMVGPVEALTSSRAHGNVRRIRRSGLCVRRGWRPGDVHGCGNLDGRHFSESQREPRPPVASRAAIKGGRARSCRRTHTARPNGWNGRPDSFQYISANTPFGARFWAPSCRSIFRRVSFRTAKRPSRHRSAAERCSPSRRAAHAVGNRLARRCQLDCLAGETPHVSAQNRARGPLARALLPDLPRRAGP